MPYLRCRETDFFLAVCVSVFALIFIKLIYFICMFPSVMFIQIRKFVSSYRLFFLVLLVLRSEMSERSHHWECILNLYINII